jgi:hypothetical protein
MAQHKVTPLRINLRNKTVQKTVINNQSPITSTIESVVAGKNVDSLDEEDIIVRKTFSPTVRKSKSILKNTRKKILSESSCSSPEAPVFPVDKVASKFVRPVSTRDAAKLTSTFFEAVYDGNLSNDTSSSSSSSSDSSSEDQNIDDLNEMLANLDVEEQQVIIIKIVLFT